MAKNKVSDLITDQEIAFARLVLSGTMTDRRAAEAVGLHPDSAAYTKSKPRVRAYMLERRAAVQQQLVEQDSHLSRRAVEEVRRLNLSREQVLARLWEVANLSPEMTRGSITGQVKALAMIVAIEGLIPDRRAVPAQNKTAPPPVNAQIYTAACPLRPAVGLVEQQKKAIDPQPGPALAQEEDDPSLTAPGPAGDAPPPPSPVFDPSESSFANRFKPLATTPSSPYARVPGSAPDKRVPSSIEKNPSTWRLRL
jgi:hypothetical protein